MPSTFEDYTVMGSWKGRGDLYIQLVKVLYSKFPTYRMVRDSNPRPQRWETIFIRTGTMRYYLLRMRQDQKYCPGSL